ncbi:uncharacterized protein LOC116107911 isoform X3 [Pistacia vera]|uniref:uncharacterized protein LOC116107911 isoform X3 n=1 Tax=Pistacia vera TaxID=55513 RepID=UPI0012631804|nr:uncharacterized protein LOC116107911 isoform X3 [Pistacia vera]
MEGLPWFPGQICSIIVVRWRHFWIMIIHLKELCLLLIGPISQVCIGKASWKKMHGTTVSRLRNGSFLHHFPSALPCGARTRDQSGSSQSYCILDCIFQEMGFCAAHEWKARKPHI